nr:helix-turn-helix transcriptional regulator [Morganella morganii]
MFIGGKIKCQRLKNCLTGKELSIKINISQQQLSRYETGASLIPLDKLLMLADVLNISVSYFLMKWVVMKNKFNLTNINILLFNQTDR